MCFISDHKYIAFFASFEIYMAFFGKISFISPVMPLKFNLPANMLRFLCTFLGGCFQ